MNISIAIAVFLAVFIFFRFIFPFFYTLIIYLRQPITPNYIEKNTSAANISTIRKVALEELEGFAFEPLIWFTLDSVEGKCDCVFLKHKTLAIWAILRFRPYFLSGYPIEFYSVNEQNRLLRTVNRWPDLLPFPNFDSLNTNVTDIAEHLAVHQKRLQNSLPISSDEVFSRITENYESYLDFHLKHKNLVNVQGSFFLTLPKTIAMAMLSVRKIRLYKKPYRTPLTSTENQCAYYAECYRQEEARLKTLKNRKVVTVMFLLFTLSISLFAWYLGFGWKIGLFIVAVLFIHESGHAIAMRLFGYREIFMVFLPMLGAVVTGKVKDLSAWKRAVILLAGPTPGLLFGMWILVQPHAFSRTDDLYIFALTAFILNLFNLAPLKSLDGGQLLELLAPSTNTSLKLIFDIVSIGAAVTLGVIWDSPVLFFIAYILLIGARFNHNIRRLLKLDPGGEVTNPRLESLFEACRNSFKNKSFSFQYRMIKRAIEPSAVRPATITEKMAVAFVLIVLWFGAGIIYYEFNQYNKVRNEFNATYNRYNDGESDSYLDPNLLQQLQANAAKLDEQDNRKIDLKVSEAMALSGCDLLPALENIIKLNKNGFFNSHASIVNWYLSAGEQQLEHDNLSEYIPKLEQLLVTIAELSPNTFSPTLPYKLKLAEAYDKQGQHEKSEQLLAALYQESANHSNLYPKQSDILHAQVWRAIDQGDYNRSLSILENSNFDYQTKDSNNLLSFDYAWILFEQGNLPEAVARMEQAAKIKPVQNWSNFIKSNENKPQNTFNKYALDLVFMLQQSGQLEAAQKVFVDAKKQRICKYKENWNALGDGPTYQLKRKIALRQAVETSCAALFEDVRRLD